MLARKPEERPSVKEILNSRFLNNLSYNEQAVKTTIKSKMEIVLTK